MRPNAPTASAAYATDFLFEPASVGALRTELSSVRGNASPAGAIRSQAARGSKLDRHQHIGKGTIGKEPFRILLNDLRLAHAAFIAETPIDKPWR